MEDYQQKQQEVPSDHQTFPSPEKTPTIMHLTILTDESNALHPEDLQLPLDELSADRT
jgi:hypothetical protein